MTHVWIVENTMGRVDGVYSSKTSIVSAVVRYYDNISKDCPIKIDHETEDRLEIKAEYSFTFRCRTTEECDLIIANRVEVIE